jgi:hypothetical protein
MTSLGHKIFGFLASSPTFFSALSPMSLFTSFVEDSIITPLLRILINRSGFMQKSFGLTVLVKISFVFVEKSIFVASLVGKINTLCLFAVLLGCLVTRPPDWEAILAYVGGGATALFKAKSTESFTEFWTCVNISFSVFRVQTFFVYSLARSFRALCRLQISVQAWVLLTIGSLVEHTNSMKTVTATCLPCLELI